MRSTSRCSQAVAFLFAELGIALVIGLPFFGAERFQFGIDLGFAFLELLSEHVLRKVLFFQRELICCQFTVQFSALCVVGSTEPLSSPAGLGLAFARTLCPLLEAGSPLLQAVRRFATSEFSTATLANPWLVSNPRSKRSSLMTFCLPRKAPNVRLGKLDGIDVLGLFCGHNGNELRRRLFGRSGSGLPALAPPGPLFKRQVTVPTWRDLCLFPDQAEPKPSGANRG